MDTLVMAVRCALLIVVTVTFAALWSGDVPDRVAVIDRPSRFPFEKRDSNSKGRAKVYESPEGEHGVETSAAAPTVESRQNAPLPEDISAGTYLIVDQFGRSETRVISGRGAARDVFSRNHYTVEIGTSRWHFIRLDLTGTDRMAAIPSTESKLR